MVPSVRQSKLDIQGRHDSRYSVGSDCARSRRLKNPSRKVLIADHRHPGTRFSILLVLKRSPASRFTITSFFLSFRQHLFTLSESSSATYLFVPSSDGRGSASLGAGLPAEPSAPYSCGSYVGNGTRNPSVGTFSPRLKHCQSQSAVTTGIPCL